MSNVLQRSNVEFGKRILLDRLTTDQQSLADPHNLDGGPGDDYQYANCFDPYNFGIGADCSGLCGILCGAALFGPSKMFWGRLFSTETFAAWANSVGGWKQTTQQDLVNGSYPIKVMIMHGGGGPDSHMAMVLDGVNAESNGDYGTCTATNEITGPASNFWNDWWVYEGTINEDTTWRQPMTYPQGLDYAGGAISGADLAAAGITFVCRYINPGGSGLPGKQLLAPEFIDLVQNGIGVVFNYETTATFTLTDDGATDAQWALSYVQGLLNAAAAAGISVDPNYQPVIYFSADFDEAPDQDVTVENYLSGAAKVLGGINNVGLYGAYYICMRAQGVLGTGLRLWQTEAWSGGNIFAGISIMQRNALGYKTIDGVECDIDEAHLTDIGAFYASSAAPQPSSGGDSDTPPPVVTPPTPTPPTDDQMLSYVFGQMQPYAQLSGDATELARIKQDVINGTPLTIVDALSGYIYGVLPIKPSTPVAAGVLMNK